MNCRIFIENPPPFKQAFRGPSRSLVRVPVEEGVDIAQRYLDAGLRIAGLHHADLDRYEAMQLRDEIPPERYDAFEYAYALEQHLGGYRGRLAPHRVVVYQSPEEQEGKFRELAVHGIHDVILVGKPFTLPPEGAVYRTTVEEMLAHLGRLAPELRLRLGVIGIHTRRNEPARIADKFVAAGGKLQVMGQFLDEAGTMIAFMEGLAREFERRGLSFEGLEWNVGLAMFALKDRGFYAKLMRRPSLACEERFRGLQSVEERLAASIEMGLEFAQRVKERGDAIGLDIGFSIQPIIERYLDGKIHPAVYGTIELARGLGRL